MDDNNVNNNINDNNDDAGNGSVPAGNGGGSDADREIDAAFSFPYRKYLTGAACVLCAAGVGFGAWYGISRRVAVGNADRQMELLAEVRQQMELPEGRPGATQQGQEDASWDGDATTDAGKRQLGLREHETDEYMTERIDFAAHDASIAGDDLRSWLIVPGTDIDYPVMQGTEDEPLRYLWKDINGNSSKTGSLFVMADVDEDDDHEVIYGHRLVNHDLYFGPLLQWRDSADWCSEHTVAYTYDREKVTRWELCYVVGYGDEYDTVYYYPYYNDTDDWATLVDNIASKASWTGADLLQSDHMLVLSTCSGRKAGLSDRTYLVYRDAAVYEYGEATWDGGSMQGIFGSEFGTGSVDMTAVPDDVENIEYAGDMDGADVDVD